MEEAKRIIFPLLTTNCSLHIRVPSSKPVAYPLASLSRTLR